jgi:hypothetical protein
MGKTYTRQAKKFDDDFSSGRSGKHSRHAMGRKTHGMKTLNSYVEENYEVEEVVELEIDEVQKHTN